jgi:hypothetical protein
MHVKLGSRTSIRSATAIAVIVAYRSQFTGRPTHQQHVVVWYHDESTFYAHDWCKSGWVHSSETAVPYAKGKGLSQMVADVVSADYGWLHSPDGKQEVQVFFKAGKN